MSEHRPIRDLLGPYVLNSLSPEEETKVREHLEHCGDCRDEEQSLLRTYEHLTEHAGLAEAPPPSLKNRVLADLPRRERRRAPLFAAAAAIFVLVALGVLYGAGFFTSNTTSVVLQPTDFAPQAGGELVVRRDAPNVEATLEVWNLPKPASDEYYELWFGRGEGRVSAGTFTVDDQGRTRLSMTVPQTTGEYERVGITLEEFPKEPSMDSPTVVLGGEVEDS